MGNGIFANGKQLAELQEKVLRCQTLLSSIEGLTRNDALAAPAVVLNHLAAMGGDELMALLDLLDGVGHHDIRKPFTG